MDTMPKGIVMQRIMTPCIFLIIFKFRKSQNSHSLDKEENAKFNATILVMLSCRGIS